ncbi:hypothetical protein [Nitrososphaera viennensis]|nr:hypothetical protein [Nitrososphaera viennensis]
MFKSRMDKYSAAINVLFLSAMALQSWHFVEHSVKLEQHIVQSCASCLGILGNYFDPVVLHLVYNIAVFAPFLTAFVLIQRPDAVEKELSEPVTGPKKDFVEEQDDLL